jgi:hypothetical protein
VRSALRPANQKARALLKKLQALAERGIDGERLSAQRKITRLKRRFDFSVPDPTETPDLFAGRFRPASQARRVYAFEPTEFDVANSVKWAIESATKIRCLYRGGELLAEAAPSTARRLTDVADHIARSFRALLGRFSAVEGVSAADRGAFVMGLYDGMMNEAREIGQRLPGRSSLKKARKGKKMAASETTGLHVHPYTIAVSLGKQIRFSAPLAQITAELEAVAQKCLTTKTSSA